MTEIEFLERLDKIYNKYDRKYLVNSGSSNGNLMTPSDMDNMIQSINAGLNDIRFILARGNKGVDASGNAVKLTDHEIDRIIAKLSQMITNKQARNNADLLNTIFNGTNAKASRISAKGKSDIESIVEAIDTSIRNIEENKKELDKFVRENRRRELNNQMKSMFASVKNYIRQSSQSLSSFVRSSMSHSNNNGSSGNGGNNGGNNRGNNGGNNRGGSSLPSTSWNSRLQKNYENIKQLSTLNEKYNLKIDKDIEELEERNEKLRGKYRNAQELLKKKFGWDLSGEQVKGLADDFGKLDALEESAEGIKSKFGENSNEYKRALARLEDLKVSITKQYNIGYEIFSELYSLDGSLFFDPQKFKRDMADINDEAEGISVRCRDIVDNSQEIINATEDWKSSIREVANAYQTVRGSVGNVYTKLRDYTKFWREQDEWLTKMVATFGLTADKFEDYRKASYKAGKELALQYGKTQEDMVKLQQGYAEAVGRNIALTKANYEAQFQLSRLMGDEDALGFTSGAEQFGVSINDARDRLYDTYQINQKMGVSWAKTTKTLINNLKVAQKYNFQGGLDNMMKMTVWSNAVKLNMETVGNIADKLSSPEGAIETAARLQVLGGNFATLANPLQMLYESLDDVGGLAERVQNMFSDLGHFDRDLGQVRITAPDRLRIKAAAEAYGMAYEEALEMVNRDAMRKTIMQDVRFNPGISKENREFLANIAQWNNRSKQFEVSTYDESLMQVVQKSITSLSNADIEKLRNEPDEDIKKIADRTYSIDENFKRFVLGYKMSAAGVQDGMRSQVINATKTGQSIIGSLDYIGGLINAIYGVLTVMAVGQGLKGVSNLGKGIRGVGKGIVSRNANKKTPWGSVKRGVGRGLKGLGKGIAKGGPAGLVILGADMIGSNNIANFFGADEGSHVQKGIDIALDAGGWASTGALVGSLFPGPGTLAGAIIGGVGGAGYGIYKNYINPETRNDKTTGNGWFDQIPDTSWIPFQDGITKLARGGDGFIGSGQTLAVPSVEVTPVQDGVSLLRPSKASGNAPTVSEPKTYPVQDGVSKVAVSSPSDQAVFAKHGGPFDKLFNVILPQVEETYQYVKNISSSSVTGKNVFYPDITRPNVAARPEIASLFSKGKDETEKMVGGMVSQVTKSYQDFMNISNTLQQRKSMFLNSSGARTSLAQFVRNNNMTGGNRMNVFSPFSSTNISRNLVSTSKNTFNNGVLSPILGNETSIVSTKPIGGEKTEIRRENASEGASRKAAKAESQKPIGGKIDLNINGTLKLDLGNAGQVDIIKELKQNPVFVREISKILWEEMSKSINGGKSKSWKERYAYMPS